MQLLEEGYTYKISKIQGIIVLCIMSKEAVQIPKTFDDLLDLFSD